MDPAPNGPDDEILANGIDGESGHYALPPLNVSVLSDAIVGEPVDPAALADLRRHWFQVKEPTYALKEGRSPHRLDEAGWGVIFHADADPAIRDALRPLLDRRKAQAGDLYREYWGQADPKVPKGPTYRAGYLNDSKPKFLADRGAGPGDVDPTHVPYYLLIVGDPADIPFAFQYQLDLPYAVGRLWFETAAEYNQYARSVATWEESGRARPPKLTMFGVRNPGDRTTQVGADRLVTPLAAALADVETWKVDPVMAEGATKARLARLFGGGETPALLLTESHGMVFRDGSPRQLDEQGALICQDWPGPLAWDQAILEDHYFGGGDVAAGSDLHGLITFHFACYGAGTPRLDSFAKQALGGPGQIAPRDFVARLPRRLLAPPGGGGGALAVIGHVDRSWGWSFVWPGAGTQIATFESVLRRLMKGAPAGFALEPMNNRSAELADDLASEIERHDNGLSVSPVDLAKMWTSRNDARGFILLGDPAVRLAPAGACNSPGEDQPAASG